MANQLDRINDLSKQINEENLKIKHDKAQKENRIKKNTFKKQKKEGGNKKTR